MSFPPPIIPQTAEQAIARDQIAGLDAVRLDNPRAELERLRQAIREHRETHRASGVVPLGSLDAGLDGEVVVPLMLREDANLKLWAHIGESA